ncbi:MAG: hypothetical protein HY735_02805 [Verrucomicrobia bacterium]|nr:hypothetical protein [Verrucomicrobiota bacterium]
MNTARFATSFKKSALKETAEDTNAQNSGEGTDRRRSLTNPEIGRRSVNPRLSISFRLFTFSTVSTVKEIQAAIPQLSRAEIEQVRDWIDDYLEDQLELTDDVKGKLDQSRREISSGQYATRQPK